MGFVQADRRRSGDSGRTGPVPSPVRPPGTRPPCVAAGTSGQPQRKMQDKQGRDAASVPVIPEAAVHRGGGLRRPVLWKERRRLTEMQAAKTSRNDVLSFFSEGSNATPPPPDFRRMSLYPRRYSSHQTGDRDLAPSNLTVELVEGRVTLCRDASAAAGAVTTVRRTAFGCGRLVQTFTPRFWPSTQRPRPSHTPAQGLPPPRTPSPHRRAAASCRLSITVAPLRLRPAILDPRPGSGASSGTGIHTNTKRGR